MQIVGPTAGNTRVVTIPDANVTLLYSGGALGTPSSGTLTNCTFSNDQISGDKVHGGTISAFASTGIDDNAVSTAITIDSNGSVGIGTASPAVKLQVNGSAQINKPSDYWGGIVGSFLEVGISHGVIGSNGAYGCDIIGNGYRNTSGTWTSLGNDSNVGAAIVSLRPQGNIVFGADLTKNSGDNYIVTERMRITAAGNVGIGTTSPVNKLDVEGAIAIGAAYSGTSTAPTNGLIVEGNVGIGVATVTAALHLKACTAAANTASLKINAGTVATTPVSGNIESDGTHLWWTDSSGTRKQLDN